MRSLTFLETIGTGAFGSVYLAELTSGNNFRRNIAVKILLANKQDSNQIMSRVRDEARLLGLLQDDEILQVISLEKINGHDAILMEFVEGVDIAGIVKGKYPLPLKTLSMIGAISAGVLYRAHTAVDPRTQKPLNVIHRDVKPANIMITKNGGVKICDFGVARARFEGQESITLDPDMLLGTLNYMAPEYIRTGEITPAADIYGLGLSLLEIATGKKFGRPKLRRKEYEKRLFELLQEIEGSHQLRNIIQQMLLWDDKQRPNGQQCEQMLYAAADELSGLSLRRWAAEYIPRLLTQRRQFPDGLGLLGSTIDLNQDQVIKEDVPTEQPVESQERNESENSRSSATPSSSARLTYEPKQGAILGIVTGFICYTISFGLYLLLR